MSEKADQIHDVVVVGGGPAGSAAAIRARKLKLSTLLVDREEFPRRRFCTGWVGPAGVALAESLGVKSRSAGASVFHGLTLRAWNFQKSAHVDESDLKGWLVDRAQFDAALLKAACKVGVGARLGAGVTGLELGEEHASLTLADGSLVRGRVVIIADGSESTTSQLAKLVPAGRQSELPGTRFLEYEAGKSAARLDVAIGASRAGQIGVIARVGTRVRVSISTREREPSPDAQFHEFIAAAVEAGVLRDAPDGQPQTCVMPSGAALDLHTHVGKRCLLVGDAGGFVSAFSNEGVYPAMRSGLLAAEAAARAFSAAVLQDELATFGATWRSELAEYLRMPNTDLGLLMPLVFNNEQMSRRVARAFVLGQPF